MAGRLQEIFEHAVGLQGPARDEYLNSACGTDEELRAEVVALLRVHDRAPKFLASPTAGSGVAATMIAAPREHEGQFIGRYKLLQLIGEGGFGSVFMAEQEKPVSRKVALKIIKLGMDTRAVIARFEAERQALALMDHPNIARVLDAGATETGRPYFVMELCKGDPIVEYCDKNSLSIEDRLDLFAQVCTAVQHAHTKGIIHRDIKPSNILVSTQDGRPHAKVIDFGIAKATASKLTEKTLFTEHKALIGTPEYMSPEQAEGSLDIDTRTDVYSLGVLLYELLTGTTPFSSKELRSAAYAEIQRIIREVEPPKPSTRLSHNTDTIASVAARRHTEPKRLGVVVRGELDWIVMKALEKDRQRRYETASGLAMDIRRYLSDEPIHAAPPNKVYRVGKFVKRHRAQIAPAALIALALLLGLAGTLWQAKIASDRAEAARISDITANARVQELKLVSDFQAIMLSQVDATRAGMRLTEDVIRRLAGALEKAKIPEAERASLADEFRRGWARVNATDAAAALIDETILKPAVKAIDERFKDQPLVDAQLRAAVSDRYKDLGLNDAAVPLAKAALEIRRRVLGEEHPGTLDCLNSMGSVLQAQGKFAEAEPYLREAMEKSRRVLGEESKETLTVLTNLGSLFSSQGKFVEAETVLRQAMEAQRRVLGQDHGDTLASMNNLAEALRSQGRLDKAEPYYREALERRRRVLGDDHPDTLFSANNMGMLLKAQGRLDEAETHHRETLEKRRRVLGEEHPLTINSIINLAGVLKPEKAEPLYREALEKYRRVLGDDHPLTLNAINNLGALLYGQARLAEAEPYMAEVVEKNRRLQGEDHPLTLTAINNLGALLNAKGEYARAVALLESLEPRTRAAFTGSNAWKLAGTLLTLGRARAALDFDAQRFTLAESNLVEAHDIFVKTRGAQHKSTVDCQRGLVKLFNAWHTAETGKGYDTKAAEWKAKLDAAPSTSNQK